MIYYIKLSNGFYPKQQNIKKKDVKYHYSKIHIKKKVFAHHTVQYFQGTTSQLIIFYYLTRNISHLIDHHNNTFIEIVYHKTLVRHFD